MFGILDRYIGKTVLNSVLITLFSLISLSGIIKFVEQLQKLKEKKNEILEIVPFVIFHSLREISSFFPISILLGVIIGIYSFGIRNELVSIQLCEFGPCKIIKSIAKTIIPLTLLIVIGSEWIIPNGEKRLYKYWSKISYDRSIFPYQSSQLWIRDKNNFVCIDKIEKNNRLIGINFFQFDKKKRLTLFDYAKTAIYQKKNGSFFR